MGLGIIELGGGMETQPKAVIVLDEDEDIREEVEIFPDYVRMVDYEKSSNGEWYESFSHCICIDTLCKIMAAVEGK